MILCLIRTEETDLACSARVREVWEGNRLSSSEPGIKKTIWRLVGHCSGQKNANWDHRKEL